MGLITITIGKDGKADIRTEGFKDGKCREVTAKLEESLGVVRDRHHTVQIDKELEVTR